jgi:colanic acid/amylovoran biosynthesis protein
MNILIDGSSYGLDNVGDAAMLQVAAKRLLDLWPDAQISVFTKNAGRLRSLNPALRPLSLRGRDVWFQPTYLTEWTQSYLPGEMSRYLARKELALREREHRLVPLLTHYKMKLDKVDDPRDLSSFRNAFDTADLVLSTGGGFLNDAIARHGSRVLRTINYAVKRGVPTAMLGQGIGPVAGPALFDEFSDVLPKVGLIALRETKYGMPLLKRMGVREGRIAVTGDDTVEMAYTTRKERLGTGLGINIRMADYAGMTMDVIGSVGRVVDRWRMRTGADLIPVPIDLPRDLATVRENFDGIEDDTDFSPADSLVETVIRQAARCRVIITGSYHAAVFALSQGIPCIGIANSDYYLNKFDGLQDMFGSEGAASADMRQQGALDRLSRTLDLFWQNADDLRPRLLAEARNQIELGHQAYASLKTLV